MADDRKHPDSADDANPPALPERDSPVARPTLDEGEMYVFSEADCADIAAEFYAFARELPALSDSQAEEAATMMYELMTGAWTSHATDG